ncbi:MAG: PAS domain S-box protein [Candidatus Bipolaricaulota bacterium]
MEFTDRNCREFMEQLPEAVFLETLEGDILDVNNEACELLGYSKEELLGMEVGDLVPEGAPAFLPDEIDKATRSVDPMETVNFHKDGTKIPVEVRGKIIEVDGKERILASVSDISGRKVAEEKFRKLFDQGPEPAVFLDSNCRIMDVNSRFEEVFNYKLEEVRGENVNDLIVPDRLREEARELDKEAEQGYMNYETVRQGKSREFPVSISANPVSVADETFVLGIYKDITERVEAERDLQKSEKRLQWALEGTRAGLWDWNVQTGEVVFDERWAEIVGYTLEELQPVTIQTWKELAHPEDLKRSDELLEKHFNGETEVYECEARMKHKNGDWVWVLDRGRVVEWNEQGEPTRMVGTHQDITERKKTEQALNEERNKLKKLHDAVEELQRQDTEEELLQIAVDVAENMLDFGLCAIAILEGEKLVPKANSTEVDPDQTATFKVGEGIAGKTVQQGETIRGDDVRSFPEAELNNDDFRAFISAPIGNIGNLQVVSKEVGSFNKSDAELLELLTGHLRGELNRVRLEEQLREKADSIKSTSDKLESLHNVARRLESANEDQEVFQLGVEAAVETLEFLVCSFSVARGDHFEVMATSEESPKEWTHEDMPIDEGLTGKTYRTRETYVFGDLREVEEAKPARPEYRSIISSPVGDIGVFQVLSEQVEAFGEEDARLAELLCGHVYEATQRVRLEDELKEEAIHDPLTGLYNRRYLKERLSDERGRAERYDKPIAFIMMDINSFKEINDRYTHQTGDKVLREVADLLQANVRDADTVVRYGGDEFLVVLPETNGDSKHTADRLSNKLAEWNEGSDLIDFTLTMAMGISHWSPEQDRDIEEALKEADQKMYEDKGR